MFSFEGLIATPFGYLLDGLHRLTSNYAIALILFAFMAQLVMVPLNRKNQSNRAKKQRLTPIVAQLKKQYADNTEKQIDEIAALYDREKYSIAGTFVLSILPFFIFVPIFQAVAQPISYMFHESPDTVAAILRVMQEEAPELFVSGYNQVAAIRHIQDFAEIIKTEVPEVSARTLEGLKYNFLGLDMSTVPGIHVLGKSEWAWDWAHIGVILFPIVYMSRRVYMLVAGIIKTYADYAKRKKEAQTADEPLPKLPNPPVVQLLFLFLSLTAMFAVPIAMNLYWLCGGIFSTLLNKTIYKKKKAAASKETAAEEAAVQA